MNIPKYVGKKIKTFRTLKKLTQQEVGDYLNTTSQTISRYESGILQPGNDTLFKLAELFQVSINDFFPSNNFEYGSELYIIFQKISSEFRIPIFIIENIFMDLKIENGTSLNYSKIKTAIQTWLYEKNSVANSAETNFTDDYKSNLFKNAKQYLLNSEWETIEFILKNAIKRNSIENSK